MFSCRQIFLKLEIKRPVTTEMAEDDSVDGSLEDFLEKEGIKFDRDAIHRHSSPVRAFKGGSANFDSTDPKSYDISDMHADLLLPNCGKVSDLLQAQGFRVKNLTQHDIDLEQKVAVGAVDSWAESVIPCLLELNERLNNRSNDLVDVTLESKQRQVSHEALESSVRDLQERLLASERRTVELESKLHKQNIDLKRASTETKDLSQDAKKALKGMEDKVKESERRVRQRESELERLKVKLVSVAKKERETAERHRSALDMLRKGEVSFDSKNRSVSSTGLGEVTGLLKRRGPTAADVIAALENQRDSLEERNAELDGQVVDLTVALRDSANNSRNTSVHEGDALNSSTESANSVEADLSNRPESARAMYEKIQAQGRSIAMLEHRCEVFKATEVDNAQLTSQLRDRNEELREMVENLRLELQARPSPKQLADKEKEVREAEEKLHDLVMMRGEAAELDAWRKHMSVSDRIKMDKRNHELGLWVLDSLPKAVTKEVLQSVCRELDVSDVSEVTPSIQKLKAVVKLVPRMENFISKVSSYIFERDRSILELQGRGLNGKERPTMEDVLPVLQDWWAIMGKVEKLATFQDKVLAELHRREQLLSAQTGAPSENEYDFGPGQRFKWSDKELGKAHGLLRECINFEVEVMRNKKSYRAADDYIRDFPDQMVSKHLSHVCYLFNVPNLEGLIPRMNQVYLFSEQMNNFLNSVRHSLSMRGAPDATVLVEIQRVVSLWQQEATTTEARAQ